MAACSKYTHSRSVYNLFKLSTPYLPNPPFNSSANILPLVLVFYTCWVCGWGGEGVRGTQVRDAESRRIEQCILHLACAERGESG